MARVWAKDQLRLHVHVAKFHASRYAGARLHDCKRIAGSHRRIRHTDLSFGAGECADGFDLWIL